MPRQKLTDKSVQALVALCLWFHHLILLEAPCPFARQIDPIPPQRLVCSLAQFLQRCLAD